MDGLEVVEMKLSEVEDGVRIDAELYRKHFVQFLHHLKNQKTTTLQIEADVVKKGIFDIKASSYNLRGIPFVRIGNLKNMLIDTSDIIYIPESENEKNIDTFLKKDDIILSKTANAAASLVNIECCNTSQDTVAIKLKPDSQLLSHFIVVYLNTISGLKEMQRWFTGNIQMHLNLTDCKTKMLIPVFEKHFQSAIKTLFEKSINKNEETISKYKQAESLLLNELGLHNWQPAQANTEVKSFKNSFWDSGRLDAEYYQPKYDEIIERIKNYKYGFGTFGNLIDRITTGEYSEQYYPKGKGLNFYIRSTNIIGGQIEIDEDYFVKASKFTKIAKEGDILTARVGTIGVFGCVTKEVEGSVYSDNVLCFHFPQTFLPNVYTLYFNTKLNWELVDRLARGSVQQRLNQETLRDLIVPIIDGRVQQKVSDIIQQSFSLKKQSEQLLQTAKQAVEMAIEEGEEKAMEFIKNK